jgi:hypothetical protein
MAISPPDHYEMGVLLSWAFQPAEEPMLLGLLEQGRQDAQAWAEDNGLTEVLEGGTPGNGAEQSKEARVQVS